MEVRAVEDIVELRSTSLEGGSQLKETVLSRQVNYEPLSNVNPKLNLYPIDKLNDVSNVTDSIRLQEALVVHDLLNNLLGLSGAYIRYNNDFNPYNGDIPEFKIVKKMDASLKAFSKKMLQYGSYYVSLTRASEEWSDISFGVVLQRLSFEIEKFLNEVYLKLFVERLEKEFNENPNFSIREFKQIINDDTEVGKQLTILHNFVLKINDEMNLRKNTDLNQVSLDNFMSEVNQFNQNDDLMPILIERNISPVAKGGTILKILYRMIQENLGDRSTVQFMENLLINISENYYNILNEWMIQGELNDPYDEFMICNTMKNVNQVNILNPIECDRIWLTQYGIRKDGLLDRFDHGNDTNTINNNSNSGDSSTGTTNHNGNILLFKILTTGKLLNVIKKSLDIVNIPVSNDDFNSTNNFHISNFVELMEGTNFELYVDKWYDRANKLCLQLLYEGYNLNGFLEDLQKWFFSYNNGHFTSQILYSNLNELSRHHSNEYKIATENKLKQKYQINQKIILESRSTGMNENLVIKLMTIQMDSNSFGDVISKYIKSEKQTIRENDTRNFANLDTLRDVVLQEFEQAIATSALSSSGSGSTNMNNEQHEHNDSASNQHIQLSNVHYIKYDIGIPFPINIIINRSNVSQFQLINRYLNILNYHDTILNETWIEINKNKIWKYSGFNQDIRDQIIRKSRIIHNHMTNFIKSIQEYFNQDVIDYEMSKCYDVENTRSVVDLQSVLSESLTNILHDYCLMDLIDVQLQIFDIINKFCKFLTSMRYKLCKLDYSLYQRYLNESGHNYNEEDLISKVPEYITFINTVAVSFQQHKDAMLEGLWYNYRGQEHPLSRANRDQTTIITNHGQRLLASYKLTNSVG